jgi:heptosyltransferase I
MKERGSYWLRKFDRFIGIPLVMILGLLRKAQKNPISHPCRIALLKTAGIGDIVLLTGIIQDLKMHYLEATITLYTGSSNAEMGDLIEGITVIVLPIKHPLKSIKTIRKSTYELWIDFGPWPRINAILSHFAHAAFKIGFKTKNEFRHYVYDRVVEHKDTQHEIENFRDLLRSLHLPCHHSPFVPIPKQPVIPHRIAIHPFPGGFNPFIREWPKERWKELLEHLSQQNFELYLTGGIHDKEKIDALIGLCNHKDNLFNVAGKNTLKETAVLLKTARLVISVDTGIMHLAAALGRPIISLHGPTPPTRWGAIGSHVCFLTCCANFLHCTHRKLKTSMLHISVINVLNALKGIINQPFE